MPRSAGAGRTVLSALRVRAHFGEVLRRVERERGSVVIEKRGIPRAVLLSLQEYVRLAAPEPDILRIIGETAVRTGASRLTAGQIDAEIRAVRARKPKR